MIRPDPGHDQAPGVHDPLAARLRGFGPIGLLALAAIVLAGNYPVPPLGALLALAWARWSRTPWRDIGFVRPTSWTRDLVAGIAFGVAFKMLMKAVVMPLWHAPPVNSAFHDLAGNAAGLPGAVYLVVVGGGFGEETVFRGYLFERFAALLGPSRGAKAATILGTSAVFALLHYPDQGLAGVEQATITGLAFGTMFALTGRLWMSMAAHASFDLTALFLIYRDLESTVAHLVFP